MWPVAAAITNFSFDAFKATCPALIQIKSNKQLGALKASHTLRAKSKKNILRYYFT
jgi:hypothetical protein